MKSVFIVSVPRSASTTLEQVCVKGLRELGFKASGEILNSSYSRIKIPQYAKKDKQFKNLKAQCLRYAEFRIIRDVIQPHFIVHNLDWIMERFNMIFLLRPLDEIMVSRKRLGWKMPRKTVLRYQTMLLDIPEQESYKHLHYYDFIRDNPGKLIEILQGWYPECPAFNYMDGRFTLKRNSTFMSLKQAGVKPRKKSKKKG